MMMMMMVLAMATAIAPAPAATAKAEQLLTRACDARRDTHKAAILEAMEVAADRGDLALPESWLPVQLSDCNGRSIIGEIAEELCGPEYHFHVVCDPSHVEKKDMKQANGSGTVSHDAFPITISMRSWRNTKPCACPMPKLTKADDEAEDAAEADDAPAPKPAVPASKTSSPRKKPTQ